MPVMSHWGGYDWSGCNHVPIEIPRNMMGAPWLPHKIPWSVMFFPKHNGHLPGGLTTPFADTAICRYSHYPQLIYPYKIPYYIPVRSPITIISHHSDTYPIHSHSNFQLWAGKPSRPAAQPSFQVVPCPASTQLQKRKTYSTDQMHVKTWHRGCRDPGTLDTRWGGTLMPQDGPLETNGMRFKKLWHFFRNHGDYWYMIILCCIRWDCLREIYQKHVLFYIKYSKI